MREIILGPPGTGKTTRLIDMVSVELARGVPPDRIGYVSFTKRAAREAIDRACSKFQLSRDDFPHFSTLHSLCFRQLGLSSGDVLQGTHLQEFADDIGITIKGNLGDESGVWEGFHSGDRLLYMENLSRIRNVPLEDMYREFDDGLSWNQLEMVAGGIEQYKRERGLMDFTDMLSEFVSGELNVDLDVLLVDEAQDLSRLQWLVVNQLARGCRRVIVAGDDDQAIYRWAGADVEHFIAMTGNITVLDRSHRVPPALQSAALGIIGEVDNRRPKVWMPRAGAGRLELESAFEEVLITGETLVLARNSYLLDRVVEPHFRHVGVEYERHGRRSVRESDMEIIRAWETLRRGEPILAAVARKMYEYMLVGVNIVAGRRALAEWEDEEMVDAQMLRRRGGMLATDDQNWWVALGKFPEQEVAYIRAVLERRHRLGQHRVTLSTIHGSKGGEADHVVLLTEMAKRTHREMHVWPEDEMRVWYVGVTRAKERLTLVESRNARRCPWL
jgi:DNA helicase-2/ATP-dependent DNA helicase PcrA